MAAGNLFSAPADEFFQTVDEIRLIKKMRNAEDAHHEEMMELLKKYNYVVQEYKKLGVSRDVAFDIIHDNIEKIDLTYDEINARIHAGIEALELQK